MSILIIHTFVHTYVHRYIHIYIHACIHTCMQMTISYCYAKLFFFFFYLGCPNQVSPKLIDQPQISLMQWKSEVGALEMAIEGMIKVGPLIIPSNELVFSLLLKSCWALSLSFSCDRNKKQCANEQLNTPRGNIIFALD